MAIQLASALHSSNIVRMLLLSVFESNSCQNRHLHGLMGHLDPSKWQFKAQFQSTTSCIDSSEYCPDENGVNCWLMEAR